MTRSYNDLYTWQSPLVINNDDNDYVMEHTDGTVSLAILWPGISTELKSQGKIDGLFSNYYQVLDSLSSRHGIIVENHWIRQFDGTLAEQYQEYGRQNAVRAQELSAIIRSSLANHLGNRAMSNLAFTILTLPSHQSPFAGMFPNRVVKKTKQRGRLLLDLAEDFITHIPQAEICTTDEYELLIWESYHRDKARDNDIPLPNSRFKLCQRVGQKPLYEDNYLRLGDTYTRVALVLDYPDASPNWFYDLSREFGIEIHVTQIIKPLDKGNETRKSASQSERAQESASAIGGEDERGKLKDLDGFREYVSAHKLSILGNCYVLKFHHTNRKYLDERYRQIKSALEGAVIKDDEEEIARLYWRVSQPGQGYKSAYIRTDHTWQVAHWHLARAFSAEGRHEDAIDEIEGYLELVDAAIGDDSPAEDQLEDYLAALLDYGTILSRAEREDEARPAKETLELCLHSVERATVESKRKHHHISGAGPG